MDFSHINWLAAITAAILNFLLGGIWYSNILFGKSWIQDNGLTKEQLENRKPGKIFGFAALFFILMAVNLAIFLSGPKIDVTWGAQAGFLAGIWTFSAIAVHSLFELKSWRLILINGGFSVISLTLMGAIIGVWR